MPRTMLPHQLSYWCGLASGVLVSYLTPRLLRVLVKVLLGRRTKKVLENVAVKPSLEEHTKEFDRRVIEVTPTVHVAIGYALANSIMIQAPEGLIIVDVTESVESGEEVLKAFRKISDKPIKALIYTHNHADHCFGAKAFIEDALNPPQIWAYKTFDEILKSFLTRVNGGATRRAYRQFGVLLPNPSVVNDGIGLRVKQGEGFSIGVVNPDHYLENEEDDFMIAGLKLRLFHMPGETPDQMCVYIPEQQLFIPADNIYRAFPNLYAIRGTAPREYLHWIRSLDRMREIRPKYLVPCHTKPVYGQDEIYELLTVYRDAIQYVHDQTLRWMNLGMTVDEIVPRVNLPPKLAQHPFLQEFYGTVAWSVRGCFDQYMGWFGGDARDLNPMEPGERERRMVDLAGSQSAVLQAASTALQSNEPQWALELATAVWMGDSGNKDAIRLRVEALKALSATQVSANGRNYYLVCALETEKLVTNAPTGEAKKWGVNNLTIRELFQASCVKLKGEECQDADAVYQFFFTDTNEEFALHLRNGIVEVLEKRVNDQLLTVTCETSTWRQMLLQATTAAIEITKGNLKVEGKLADLEEFNELFVKTL